MQKIALIIILLALTQSPIQAQNLLSGSVVSIGDGDTITINQNGQNIKIRLGCVDTV
jgi:micrococcal nuclease